VRGKIIDNAELNATYDELLPVIHWGSLPQLPGLVARQGPVVDGHLVDTAHQRSKTVVSASEKPLPLAWGECRRQLPVDLRLVVAVQIDAYPISLPRQDGEDSRNAVATGCGPPAARFAGCR
jgi:hypothetical protein